MSSSLFHTLNISRQDMITRLVDLDVIANNLANMNTAGFKASRSNFQELLEKANREGITIAGTQGLMQQGSLRDSGNYLDWAVQGEGFFGVRMPDGTTGYTRDGQFHLDGNRTLVTAAGLPVVWQGTIPNGISSLALTPDGQVEAVFPDGTHSICGRVQLSTFANPSALKIEGENLWIETASSGKAITGTPGTGNIGITLNNVVEQSNVDISREMTSMMADQRSFQLSVKAFQQTDTMIQQALNLRKG